MARIREETETRSRRRTTQGELRSHAGVVERRVERLSAAVAAFEQEMPRLRAPFAEDDGSAAPMAGGCRPPASRQHPTIAPVAGDGRTPAAPAPTEPAVAEARPRSR
jgi:hypothetical protein